MKVSWIMVRNNRCPGFTSTCSAQATCSTSGIGWGDGRVMVLVGDGSEPGGEAVCGGYGLVQTRPYGCGGNCWDGEGRVMVLIGDGSGPGVVAVYGGYGPVQTRPYGCGHSILEI